MMLAWSAQLATPVCLLAGKRAGKEIFQEITAMLDHEAQKQMVGCADDTSCVASIADALGVDEIVVGQLTVVGDETLFALRRIEQAEARVKGQYSIK